MFHLKKPFFSESPARTKSLKSKSPQPLGQTHVWINHLNLLELLKFRKNSVPLFCQTPREIRSQVVTDLAAGIGQFWPGFIGEIEGTDLGALAVAVEAKRKEPISVLVPISARSTSHMLPVSLHSNPFPMQRAGAKTITGAHIDHGGGVRRCLPHFGRCYLEAFQLG